ncbi:hypothetical protein COW36_19610 [bacterium (Candidatus Blackallbacteria) CG17_big_fil_post_rev_8_21_14_2_50_48_46]|uniref:Uncharacterized protein n=1 Tax=bacterium (Candidatus Blackallbacteria) CG17_big_fil_post_rev_8_21_14_2_50_48_46 TaxID=2014261 RepID=A0A2M7G0S7_9BACT|nr:MAG: hypothetical protein COW64_15685 [bacterium (Candidatus Blackallbacteria) CG18_big_fil_WC_8_21_14_2_50_49_26]PIW14860.1 MAG: hypothetical protein COW36_19610 [bacterium (Candidatus Blackallbacteria) CG17_big_fil_post_rev_8_21_14_2_50_48_46]PIW44427.1 MAG: hypothetical protein COW20_24185 [bacterium (Candidatus Blackallbacteria) CG13_big_fil_rev_8_21_14_2_50_49_14]
MNFNVNSRRNTEPLPELQSFAIPGSEKPKNSVPATVAEAPTKDLAEVQAIQGDSLNAFVLFPETSETDSSLPVQPPSAEVQKGVMLFEDLQLRRGAGVSTSSGSRTQPLDYALAKMSKEVSTLSVEQLNLSLKELTQRLSGLGNRDQAPLSAKEISQYNAALKYFGLMTDGKHLYNLSIRIPDPVSGERKPMFCTRSDIDKLTAACAAIQAEVESQPGKSDPFMPHLRSLDIPETSAKASPASRFGAPARDDFGLRGIGGGAVMARLQKNLGRLEDFKELLAQGESFVNGSAQIIAELLPQQEEVDQALGAAIVHNQAVRTELEAQGQVLANLNDVVQTLLNSSSQSIRGDLGAFNQALSPLQLEIRRSDSGQLQFFKKGEAISEADFRAALQAGLNKQTTTVAGLNQKLDKSEAELSDLKEKSEILSTKIEAAVAQGREGLEILGRAKELGQRSLQELLGIRNDPESWNQLSDDLKSLVNSKISELSQDLQQIDQLAETGRNSIELAETQLKRSAALRNQADQALARSQDLRKRTNDLLEQQQDMQEQAQALAKQAEKLETVLKRQPPPGHSELKALAESWLDSVKANFNEEQSQYQAHQKISAQARESFERAAQKLRENLNYHQQKLSDLDEQSRSRLQNALQESLAQARSLPAY